MDPGTVIERLTVSDGGQFSLAIGPAVVAVNESLVVNVRPPSSFENAIKLNLSAAAYPRNYLDLFQFRGKSEAENELHRAVHAAKLARDASATVIVLCANKFESMVNWCYAALDPMLHGNSEQIIEKDKINAIELAEKLYSFCGERLDRGRMPYQAIKSIFRLRNQLVHDKPSESLEANITKDIEKVISIVESWVDLQELPQVRAENGGPLFRIFGEAAVQKVMKYSVAVWAARATEDAVIEMRRLVASQISRVSKIEIEKVSNSDHEDSNTLTERVYAAGQ
jgi:hypothetical protein